MRSSKNMLWTSRYVLLAGTMLSTLALPQWSAASDRFGQGTIILAQGQPGGDPNDPRQKGQPKGKQAPQQKGPPQGGQPQPRQGGQPPQQGGQPQPRQTIQPPTQQRQGIPPQQGGQPQPQPRQGGQPPQQGGQPQPRQTIQSPTQQRQGIPPQQQQQPQQQVQPADGQPKDLRKGPQPKQLPKNVQQERQGVPAQQGQPQQQGQPPQGQRPQGVRRVPADQMPQPPAGQQGRQPAPGQQPAQVAPGGPLPRGGQQTQPKSFQQQQPGMANIGNVDQLRSQRRERVETGGRTVIEEPGRRFIVRENGRTFIRHDDSERFRGGNARVERRGGENFTTFRRPGGVEIISVTDSNGRLLRRIRRGPDRREVILIDNRPRGRAGFFLDLAPPVVSIPRERYIVDVSEAPPERLYETLEAPPLEPIDRAYSLEEIRYNVALRDRMRRVDINTINFETGSWEVSSDQAPALQAIADAIMQVISGNPGEVFLIEGHTDKVGSDDDNLSLSDRRAESIANILTENYQIPPENLVTQGYGEQYPKVETEGPSRENRRVTVRRITPLLQGASR